MSDSSGRQPFRLMETFRSLFYTPLYVAVAGGFLNEEGLAVEFSTCPPGHHGLSALNSGIADIAQAGPMRSIIAADWGAEVVPLHIIEINSRDGFFLVGRKPQDQFQWIDLKGATLIPVGFSPMPVASLKYALRRKEVELSEMRLIEGHSLQEATNAFRRGEGDFIHLPQPATEQLVQEGAGHLCVALGPINGHISYSSFAVTQRLLHANPEVIHRFTRGFYSAQKWLAESDSKPIAKTVAAFFPEIESIVLIKSIGRYKEQDTWAKDPLLRVDGFDALQEILVEAGLVKSRQPYERIVCTEFAQAVLG